MLPESAFWEQLCSASLWSYLEYPSLPDDREWDLELADVIVLTTDCGFMLQIPFIEKHGRCDLQIQIAHLRLCCLRLIARGRRRSAINRSPSLTVARYLHDYDVTSLLAWHCLRLDSGW